MTRIVLWLGATASFISVMLVAAVVRGDQSGMLTPSRIRIGNCSVYDVRGTFGFSRSGTTLQGPLAAVGRATFDGRGSFSVIQTTSRNGVFSTGGFEGLYEVNADCTGRWLTADGQAQIAYFVIVDDGLEFMFLSTSMGNTVTGTSKRLSRAY